MISFVQDLTYVQLVLQAKAGPEATESGQGAEDRSPASVLSVR
jgi:hypothetical protein